MSKTPGRLNIYINPDVVARVKAEAAKRNIPMNKLIEEILDKNIPKVVQVSKFIA